MSDWESEPTIPEVPRAGVYLFRTRRPGVIGQLPGYVGWVACGLSLVCLMMLGFPAWPAFLALLFNSRHTAYVGETVTLTQRRREHLQGGGRYRAGAKPWSDLQPSFYYLRLPARKWLLRSVETLGIMLFWPVYNHQKNLWNPRRVPLRSARWQRELRDRYGWSFNIRPAHLFIVILLCFVLGGAL